MRRTQANTPDSGRIAATQADLDVWIHEYDESRPRIEARDHAFGAFVPDMRIYTAVEVLFGMHYAEAVTVDDQSGRSPISRA
jgi:hypothetical protein